MTYPMTGEIMDKNTCLALINGIHFMPGWTISGKFSSPRLPYIQVTVTVETVNSNHDNAVQGYADKITIEPTVMCTPSDYTTPEELYFALFGWLMELQLHEAREFFRVGNELVAPFHPHRAEGNRAFNDAAMTSPTAF
jgi:hypothetical protein